ncbi:MAG TPA: DUF1015 domain-containing protein [Acidimicrobiales bacterium]|nr:DUF1015 domain-containing protein [Acidimicrobiales bacterium]
MTTVCHAWGMAAFSPFPGLRYDGATAPASEVIAPPYDVVDSKEREELAARSPYNSIHVELPVPDDEHRLDRYQHADALLSAWQSSGVLLLDDTPAFYVYRMHFRDEHGTERVTTGVIGALGLDPDHTGQVLPHERTMPKPKGDRLELLRATGTNLSPIWGLSLSPGLAAVAGQAVATLPAPVAASDDAGVLHELWAVTETAVLDQISSIVAASPVVIADGHHRYETACFYQAERRAADDGAARPFDAVMALVVELSEDELSVGAIHRLLAGLPAGFDLSGALGRWFTVKDGPSDLRALGEAMVLEGALGFVTPAGNRLLVPTPAVDESSEADLDSSRLDVALADLPAHELSYQHGAEHIAAAVRSGEAQAGVLLRPATVAQIADTAHSGRRMPPKTTFFQPKPRTGMVFRPVGD